MMSVKDGPVVKLPSVLLGGNTLDADNFWVWNSED